MRGKYSQTVTTAYMVNQKWWDNYSGANLPSDKFVLYDPDGYDSYGYDVNDMDRAGNFENDYAHNDALDYESTSDDDYNYRYDSAYADWGFDGTKPVRRTK
jgi:hypothetical protein